MVVAGRRRAIVRRTLDSYLFIDVEGATFFLGVCTPGMTRRQVRALAVKFLERPPQRP